MTSSQGLGQREAVFADLIWACEPLNSGELARLAQEQLGWKKSTSYTVLKKLCDRSIFANTDSVVSSLVTRDEFYVTQGRQYVDDVFDGSLPRFIAAFIGRKPLTDQQADELQRLIDAHREG